MGEYEVAAEVIHHTSLLTVVHTLRRTPQNSCSSVHKDLTESPKNVTAFSASLWLFQDAYGSSLVRKRA